MDKIHTVIKNANIKAQKAWGEKLSGIVLLVPSVVTDKKAVMTVNLKNQKGQPLTDIDFSYLEERAKKDFETSKQFKFSVLKDLMGTGFGILKHMLSKNAIKTGDYVCAVLTGGGFGAVELKRNEDDRITIETSERGYNPAYDSLKGRDCRFSELGASVKYMFDNFLNELGIGSHFATLRETGKAEIILADEFALDNKIHKNAVNLLKHISYWYVTDETDGKTYYKVNPDMRDELIRARTSAINSHAYAISQYAIAKINDLADKMFLVGPLSLAINEYIETHPTEFDNVLNLSELVDFYIKKRINELGLNYTRVLKNNFEIICDKNFSFDNNTFGADLAFDENMKPVKGRGSVYIYKLPG